jgi:hypothetical protein
MSNNNDSNLGFWVIMVAIGAIILYFWREVLTYILEIIISILRLIQTVVTELIYIGLFIGTLFIISKIYEAIKGK